MTKTGIICFFLILPLAFSCTSDESEKEKVKESRETKEFIKAVEEFIEKGNTSRKIWVTTVDSCEYILWEGSHGETGFTHKGNCKWCAIRNSKSKK